MAEPRGPLRFCLLPLSLLVLGLLLFFISSSEAAVTSIKVSSTTGTRTSNSTANSYQFNVTLTTAGGSDVIWCDIAISNDKTPSTSDYWLTGNNLRCLTGTCPAYGAVPVKSKSGLTQVLTVNGVDTTKKTGKFAIVACTDKTLYFCPFNTDLAPGCFAGEKNIAFGFVDNDPIGFLPPTAINITAPTQLVTGTATGVSASLDVAEKHMTFTWKLGSQTFTGKSPKINASTPGTFTLSVNVTSIFGYLTKNVTVTVKKGKDDTSPGEQNTPPPDNGGAIAAGIIVPVVIIAGVAGVVVYLKKTNRLKMPTGFFKK